jgi:hypothetical protein
LRRMNVLLGDGSFGPVRLIVVALTRQLTEVAPVASDGENL